MDNPIKDGQPFDLVLQGKAAGSGTDTIQSDPVRSDEVLSVETLSIIDANNNITGWKVEIGRIGAEHVVYTGGAVTAANAGVMPYPFTLSDLEHVKVTYSGATSGDLLTATLRGIRRGGQPPYVPVTL